MSLPLMEMMMRAMLEARDSRKNDSSSDDDNPDDEEEMAEEDEDSDTSTESISPISQYEAVQQYLYPSTLDRIRKEIHGHKLFVSLSFCHYDRDRKYPDEVLANIIVGPMKATRAEDEKNFKRSCFLLKSVPTDSCRAYNKDFLVALFNDAMNLLWPGHVASHVDDILLFITENSDIVIEEVVAELCKQFPRMIHLKCFARLLGQIKDNIRFTYSKVNQLYEAMQPFLWPLDDEGKDFYKATKLKMDNYRYFGFCVLFNDHFDKIKSYFLKNISKFKKYKNFAKNNYMDIVVIFAEPQLRDQLQEIVAKYKVIGSIRSYIRNLPFPYLGQSLSAIAKLGAKLKDLADSPTSTQDDQEIYKQLQSLFSSGNNPGYNKLVAIYKVLSGNEEERNSPNFPNNLSNGDIERFSYAPVSVLNRKWCFPAMDEMIRCKLSEFPLKYIDALSVERCFGFADNYEETQRFFFFMENKDNLLGYIESSDEDDQSESSDSKSDGE